MSPKRPTALIILDGWGEAPVDYPHEFNAVAQANTPRFNQIRAEYPSTLIKTSGEDVGLPDGIMGNSEVGHTNLGAGRIVWQEIVRLDKAAAQDQFESNAPIREAILKAKSTGKRLHILGLVSDGSVHSVDRHYMAILALAKRLGLESHQTVLHAFTDGRDCPPQSGLGHVSAVARWMSQEQFGTIGTVIGRYYAMDRDKRWERTQVAYDAMVRGQAATTATDAVAAIQASYDAGIHDEFIKPVVITKSAGQPVGQIQTGDCLIAINYRADRMRQICLALVKPGFSDFPVEDLNLHLVTMTPYIDGLPAQVAFEPISMTNGLGQWVATKGCTQLRIAETEKYPHVTFFFSGGREEPYPGEERRMEPSPRDVPTYDYKPEMAAAGIARQAVDALKSPGFDLMVLNFANADMVGHTGVVDAARRGCEAVDEALGQVLDVILQLGGRAIVTADHGNSEQMWNFEANAPHTQHTTNPVPLILVDPERKNSRLRNDGRLADVAPTLLEMMGLEQPQEMTGKSLIICD
jgi:2,3-bisphosphoglycerate-independent phosphoglycerate mutase